MNQDIFGMYSTKALRIVQLLVQNTGTYNPQWQRSYISTGKGDAINTVAERAALSGTISPDLFTSQATQLICPNHVPEHQIQIANGWNTERLRFSLTVEHEDHIGNLIHTVYTGYSDYADLSFSHMVDPNVRFHIDNVVTLKPTIHRTGSGEFMEHRVVSMDQLVVNNSYQGVLDTSTPVFSVTPASVFAQIQSSAYVDASGGSAVDARVQLSSTPQLVDRGNNSSQTYCANMVETYRNVQQFNEIGQSTDTYDSCYSKLASRSAGEDKFLKWLMNNSAKDVGYYAQMEPTFTLAELSRLDPAVLNTRPMRRLDGMHYAGQTSDWSSADIVTQTATILAQSLPAYLSALGFMQVVFTASNRGGVSVRPLDMVIVTDINGPNNHLNQSASVNAFKYRVATELLAGITHNNLLGMDIEVRVDLAGESWIAINMDGMPPGLYVAPTFASSLATPQMTLSQANLLQLGEGFDKLFETLYEYKTLRGGATNQTGSIRI